MKTPKLFEENKTFAKIVYLNVQSYLRSEGKLCLGYDLYWWVDYIPGHPDGEYGLKQRAQGFYSPNPRIQVPTAEWLKKGILNPPAQIVVDDKIYVLDPTQEFPTYLPKE